MEKILIFCILLLTSCKEKDLGLVSKVEGTYPVYLYVNDKDTLISPEKGNLSRFEDLRIVVKPEDYNTVAIELISTLGSNLSMKNIKIEQDGNRYRLTNLSNTMDTYSGYGDENEFYIYMAGADITKEDWPKIWTIVGGRR